MTAARVRPSYTIQDLCTQCDTFLEARSLPDKSKPETQTRQYLVDPMLRLLGSAADADPTTNARYVSEYGVTDRGTKWTDYALFIEDTPVSFIEVKQPFSKLDPHVNQLTEQIRSFNRENPRGLTVYWAMLFPSRN